MDAAKVIIPYKPDPETGRFPSIFTGDEIQFWANFSDVWYPVTNAFDGRPSDNDKPTVCYRRSCGREDITCSGSQGYYGITNIRRYP